jgi:hypothetical protein
MRPSYAPSGGPSVPEVAAMVSVDGVWRIVALRVRRGGREYNVLRVRCRGKLLLDAFTVEEVERLGVDLTTLVDEQPLASVLSLDSGRRSRRRRRTAESI